MKSINIEKLAYKRTIMSNCIKMSKEFKCKSHILISAKCLKLMIEPKKCTHKIEEPKIIYECSSCGEYSCNICKQDHVFTCKGLSFERRKKLDQEMKAKEVRIKNIHKLSINDIYIEKFCVCGHYHAKIIPSKCMKIIINNTKCTHRYPINYDFKENESMNLRKKICKNCKSIICSYCELLHAFHCVKEKKHVRFCL